LDYRHYALTQVLPVAKSIADAAGWNMEEFFRKDPGRKGGGQMELEF
jgi:hypothetical protein